MRFFHTHQNIHPNHVFQPVVSPPTVDDRKPRVNWVDFHTVMPVDSMDTNHSGRLEALAGLWRTSGPPILIHPPHHILLTSLPLLASWNMAYKQCLNSSHTVDKQLQVAHTSSITLHALTCLFIKPCNLLAEAVPGARICQAPLCNDMHGSSHPAFPHGSHVVSHDVSLPKQPKSQGKLWNTSSWSILISLTSLSTLVFPCLSNSSSKLSRRCCWYRCESESQWHPLLQRAHNALAATQLAPWLLPCFQGLPLR